MKRFILGICLCIFLLSCISNPITVENFNRKKKPAGNDASIAASLIPGLSQLINGEYIEALIYSVGTIVPFVVWVKDYSGMYPDEPNALSYTSVSMYLWSFFDGVFSGLIRERQWTQIATVDVSKLHKGMTEDEVHFIFPYPDYREVLENSGIIDEKWVYQWAGVYLYFDNGILHSWEQ